MEHCFEDFKSINEFFDDYERRAAKGRILNVAVIRDDVRVFRYAAPYDGALEGSCLYLEKLIKALLYIVGGKSILIDDRAAAEYLESVFCEGGRREFDYKFFSGVYGAPLRIAYSDALPAAVWSRPEQGGGGEGKRIGLDAGGSDIKICAVVDGEAVYSEEILWLPKLNASPLYHYAHLKGAVQKAFDKLGGAESLGVSTAGVVEDNELRIASLYFAVAKEEFEKEGRYVYKNIARDFNLGLKVANDGDVAAFGGALGTQSNRLLGIALGTSEAGGYVDENREINGWLNELAFVPLDMSPSAAVDEWSTDAGVGAKYLSQDGVIRLAGQCGIDLSAFDTLAAKLKEVQRLCESGDARAASVFERIGAYLGEAILFYSRFYSISKVMLFGRVVSGAGGEALLKKARELVFAKTDIDLVLPDEHTRRLGQAFAAALM